MRLLIIEDDRESADYLVKAFREVGYVADLAGDGDEGLSMAESGKNHFARAAARIGIEQSPLSNAIKNFQRDLGVKLFETTTRSTRLT